MLNKIKDKALATTAKVAINNTIKAYGEVLNITIDTKKHSLELETLLKGEIEPLSVSIGNYTLDNNEIVISNITTSRAWINTLSKTYLEGKAFTVPPEYLSIVKKII